MSKTDPKVIIKQIDPTLRQELFSQWPMFGDLDWTTLSKKTKVDSLFECIQNQSDHIQRDITRLMGIFSSLKTEHGLRVLSGEICLRNPSALQGWDSAGSMLDKVVYSYLHAKEAFRQAVIFLEADTCSLKQGWNTWPGVVCNKFDAGDHHISRLKKMLVEYHKSEFRGKKCEINSYSRANGAEYVFAYLPNWPDNQMVFSDLGELEPLKLPTAFSILFVFTPGSGQFAMICSGGKKKQGELRAIFYEAMTDTSVGDLLPHQRAYEMNKILDADFRFDQHNVPGVKAVDVVSLAWSSEIETADIQWSSMRFRAGLTWKQILKVIDLALAGCNHDRSLIDIGALHLRFSFTDTKYREITIKVTPHTCTLKSVQCEARRTMMEQCVTQWGFADD